MRPTLTFTTVGTNDAHAVKLAETDHLSKSTTAYALHFQLKHGDAANLRLAIESNRDVPGQQKLFDDEPLPAVEPNVTPSGKRSKAHA